MTEDDLKQAHERVTEGQRLLRQIEAMTALMQSIEPEESSLTIMIHKNDQLEILKKIGTREERLGAGVPIGGFPERFRNALVEIVRADIQALRDKFELL